MSLGLSQGHIYIHLVFLEVACVCLNSSFLSTGKNKNEELVASQRLIQIPVVFQRTSGVIIIIIWRLVLHLLFLSLPAVTLWTC